MENLFLVVYIKGLIKVLQIKDDNMECVCMVVRGGGGGGYKMRGLGRMMAICKFHAVMVNSTLHEGVQRGR